MTRAYNPEDPDQVAERQTEAKRRQQQDAADWEWFAASPQGRRIVAGLLRAAGFAQTSYADNPLRMAFAEGRRSIAAEIYARLTDAVDQRVIPALLAEVMAPDVRRSSSRNDRDASG